MPVVSRMLAGIAFAVMAAMPWGGASAQSVADVMQQWGILGVWASDGGAPPSRRNYHLGYRAVGGGRVMHERYFGAGTDGQAVISAAIVGGTLELVVDFGPQAAPGDGPCSRDLTAACVRGATAGWMAAA